MGKGVCATAEPALGGSEAGGGPCPWPKRPWGPCRLQQSGPCSMADLLSVPMSSPRLESSPPLERSPPWCPEPGFPRGFSGCWAVAHPSLVFPAAEKVSSLGKDWHKFCLKCERCNKTLTPGGHAEVRATGADGAGELCCHAGVAWWSLQGSPAPKG